MRVGLHGPACTCAAAGQRAAALMVRPQKKHCLQNKVLRTSSKGLSLGNTVYKTKFKEQVQRAEFMLIDLVAKHKIRLHFEFLLAAQL